MEEVIFIKLEQVLKRGVVALTCLMLVTTSLGCRTKTAQAEPSYFTLNATITHNPYYGFFGGYRDVWLAIQTELEKIGINLQIHTYDDWLWWEIVWGRGWNVSGEELLPPPWDDIPGWDLTLTEWWMMPTGVVRLEPLMYSWLTPPGGYNIFPWLDEKADKLLWEGMHTLDAEERRHYLWKWQEEFMHNPPMANVYYPRLREITATWVEGWDPVVRFRDVSHLALNNTLLAEVRPDRDPDTLIYAEDEEVWSLNPLFTETYMEEWVCDLVFDTLYDLSIEPWPSTGQEPPPMDFYSKPALAAAQPIFLEGPNGPNTRARVLLRDNVYWSDGVKFNATDVKFTFDLVLNIRTKAVAHGDLSPVLESVEIVNATCVDFILHEPYADISTLLSNDWGLAVIPWHTLKDVQPSQMKGHPSNIYWDQMLPGTGPFNVTDYAVDDYIRLDRNSEYFGYDLGWGPYNVTKIMLEWIWDPVDRWWALINHDIDFGDFAFPWPYIPLEEFSLYLRVWQYDHSASNPVLFNLDNPNLSNRYVRLAIAHTVPYDYIINEILRDWDIETAYRGKTLILPHHYYTDPTTEISVHLFNDDLEPYEYDIAKAQEYLDMWLYSQPVYAPYGSPEVAQGPVGDADFSGRVDFDDFFVWWKNAGLLPEEWPWAPGTDVDPDFDNDGYVTYPEDFNLWRANYGAAYPFEGAR